MDEKYIILVGDGMGDYPLDRLGGRTPLEAARTPNLDGLAQIGQMGTVRTIPDGMEPGSDVANMSLLGYDPAVYHTGRGPLEAASMGIRLDPDEIAFRCNLVFLDRDATGSVIMGDYSAGHISTPEAEKIISTLQGATSGSPLKLYPGVGYRHLLVWKGGREGLATSPPHDIMGQAISRHNEALAAEPILRSFTEQAARILDAHPVNRERQSAGKSPANAVWLWGQGKAPDMPNLGEKFGISGAMVSAVDLLKGIGVYAGLTPARVAGVTGYLDTNYAGKVAAALAALDTGNFVFLHLEAPDEASHEGSLEKKIEAIENFDQLIVGPVIEGARKFAKVRLLVVTDHYTPISRRTHVSDPVPFLLVDGLDSREGSKSGGATFCEREAQAAGRHVDSGVELFRIFMNRS
ncbi:MAG: cofactor-independent phosphoglycerate mutase [Syntrophobacteraceae bacterium]